MSIKDLTHRYFLALRQYHSARHNVAARDWFDDLCSSYRKMLEAKKWGKA